MSDDLVVLYDSGRVVVVDKPAGVLSEDVARTLDRKLVHRLDKGTSGCLVLADDARTVQRLQRLREAGGLKRVYRFVAHGVVDDVTLTSTLVRDRGDGLRGSRRDGAVGSSDGAVATTVVRRCWVGEIDGVVVSGGEAVLVTGRTHQVRIQLAEAGHPLVGEPLYLRDWRAADRRVAPSTRLMLHAWRLAFVHPNSHEDVVIEAPLLTAFDDREPGP